MTTQAISDMKKTQMKVAKQWNTRRAGLKIMHPTKGLFNPPMWSSVEVDLDPESNDEVRGSTTNWRGLRWSHANMRCRKRVTCTAHTVREKLR